MTMPFAWFDNIGSDRDATSEFLSKTFGWDTKNVGPMTFLTEGEGMPFAGDLRRNGRYKWMGSLR